MPRLRANTRRETCAFVPRQGRTCTRIRAKVAAMNDRPARDRPRPPQPGRRAHGTARISSFPCQTLILAEERTPCTTPAFRRATRRRTFATVACPGHERHASPDAKLRTAEQACTTPRHANASHAFGRRHPGTPNRKCGAWAGNHFSAHPDAHGTPWHSPTGPLREGSATLAGTFHYADTVTTPCPCPRMDPTAESRKHLPHGAAGRAARHILHLECPRPGRDDPFNRNLFVCSAPHPDFDLKAQPLCPR